MSADSIVQWGIVYQWLYETYKLKNRQHLEKLGMQTAVARKEALELEFGGALGTDLWGEGEQDPEEDGEEID
eukprot:gene6055-318_t